MTLECGIQYVLFLHIAISQCWMLSALMTHMLSSYCLGSLVQEEWFAKNRMGCWLKHKTFQQSGWRAQFSCLFHVAIAFFASLSKGQVTWVQVTWVWKQNWTCTAAGVSFVQFSSFFVSIWQMVHNQQKWCNRQPLKRCGWSPQCCMETARDVDWGRDAQQMSQCGSCSWGLMPQCCSAPHPSSGCRSLMYLSFFAMAHGS